MATTTVVTEGSLHGSPGQPHLPGHFLSWGAIIAGALCAAAVSLVLFAFGSAIGLSAVSPWPHVGLSPTVALIIVALWTAIVQVVAFAIGGYVTGRVRNSWGSVVTHERRFRDGMHGFIVWALGLLVGAAIAVSAAGSLLRAGVQATATVAAGTMSAATAATAAGGQRGATPAATPGDVAFDYLMRPGGVPAATAGAPPPAANTPAQELRPSIVRTFADALGADSLPPADRTYLASLVVMRTGLSQADAEKRVDEAFQKAKDAETKARAAADKARKASVLAAFLAAATLVIACAAACAGAVAGGRHRDEQTEIRLFGTKYFW